MDGKYHAMNQRSTQSTMRCKFSAEKETKKQIDLTVLTERTQPAKSYGSRGSMSAGWL